MQVKEVWWIRHAEGWHNRLSDNDLPDPELTPEGLEEARSIELPVLTEQENLATVLVSPLWRTLQTATAAFGTASNVKIVALNAVKEVLPGACNHPRTKAELEAAFPEVDFSGVDPTAEGAEQLDGYEHLLEQATKAIAAVEHPRVGVVTHYGVVREFFGVKLGTCGVLRTRLDISDSKWSVL